MLAFIKWISLYQYMLLAAWAISVVMYFRGKQSLPRLMEFLSLCVLFELGLAYYFARIYKDNTIVLSVYTTICVMYYLYILHDHFRLKNWAIYLRVAAAIWLFAALFFVHSNYCRHEFNISTYHLGMAISCLLIIMYFYDVFFMEGFRNIWRDPILYFSIGLLVFYTSTFLLLYKINYFLEFSKPHKISFAAQMRILGNIFLAGGYLGAALCSRDKSPYENEN